jgi:hypothetical protein
VATKLDHAFLKELEVSTMKFGKMDFNGSLEMIWLTIKR